MWRIIIAWLTPMVMGILWSDTGVPCSALSLVATNITHDVQVVLELAPPHLNQLCYEVDDDLLKVMKSPSLSTWQSIFQMRKVHDILHAHHPVQVLQISKPSWWLLRRTKR